ncbi:MAG TPA: response regulator [Pirellulales bacterium]|jgi:DNA-binding response OmpR family regulator|nr:response regulator [Pirellulales bacterium]
MTKQILLCDDEIAILRAAEFKLKGAGLKVRCASNGEDAWREIERCLPDLVVTDLQMPLLDGFGLCRRIRGSPLTRHLPIIMLTAKGFELSPAESTEKYGLFKLMVKPFSPRELLRTVEQGLQQTDSDAGGRGHASLAPVSEHPLSAEDAASAPPRRRRL